MRKLLDVNLNYEVIVIMDFSKKGRPLSPKFLGVGMVREWCGKGVGMVWEGCGKGVGKVREWCGNSVGMV